MAAERSFVHLHCHADGSMLDGLALVKDLVPAVEALGMPAIALTDHGSMAATYDLYKATKGTSVKPIFGTELYLSPDVPRSHRAPVRWNAGGDDDVSGAGAYTHMTLLAETDQGLTNMFGISSETYLSGVYRKPRADEVLLQQYSGGVIATSGCPSGEVQTWLRIGDYEKAKAAAAKFADIFGWDNFFIELMNHGLAIEQRVIADLIRMSKELRLPAVATNDLHYVKQSDAKTHEALLCVSSGSKLHDPNRFKFDAEDFYLKTPAEMRRIWDGEAPDACDNTLVIAERCQATFVEGKNLMPKFPIPDGFTEAEFFTRQVIAGMKRRFPGGIPDDRRAQAEYEIDVITQMGFPGYFLIVADFINWAKDNGIWVGPGRGSAAGSIVAYALGITELDPIKNGLIFERFLNPERLSPPDIDIDFDEKRRVEVIDYVREKYGADKVANIGTFMTVKAKAAIKDSARVLDMPYALGDRLTKVYPPPIIGRDLSLKGAYDPKNERYKEAEEFRNLVASDPDAMKVVELARGLEGVKRGHGMHAAGVIMCSEPIMNHVPLMKRDADAPVMTQFEYPTCEKIGLIKMDFLGLSNLTTIGEALRLIEENKSVDVKLRDVWEQMDDAATYTLLSSGSTLGVFQLDSGPIRSLLRLMQPDRFDDISAVLALYRPGPMAAGSHIDYADRKNGRKPVVPFHPEFAETLKDILADSYGLCIYQEQVMAIAQKVAGYSLGQADLLRRAMGKKKKEILDQEFAPFAEASRANGYSNEAITTLWEILVPFSDYAFNRAHSAAYGYISYATAFLKANYPVEYMAALLSTNADDKDKTALYLNECRQMGIAVLPPDVNSSVENYSAVGDAIRVGLIAVKNVGHRVVEAILTTRSEHGRFTSFSDFLLTCPKDVANKRAIESLIKAGAFDGFGHSRNALVLIHTDAVDAALAAKKSYGVGQDSLFDGMEDMGVGVQVPDLPEWDRMTLMRFEREMLGLYVSDHPLNGLEAALRRVAPVSVAEAKETSLSSGSDIKIAGLITSVTRKRTKKGDTWAIVEVEDLGANITVNCFPRTYDQYADLLETDTVILVDGKVEQRDDGSVTVTGNKVTSLNLAALADPDSVPVVVQVRENRLTPAVLAELKDTLRLSPGRTPVHLRILREDGTVTVLAVGSDLTVRRSPVLLTGLKAVLGLDSIV
jgi:DNA polymerase-3 subunit alpha